MSSKFGMTRLAFSFVWLAFILLACSAQPPAPTATPSPTDTPPPPTATFTPTVIPTDTPVPTATTSPTDTPAPTATVTNTPAPTVTPPPLQVVLKEDFGVPCTLLTRDDDSIQQGCQNGEYVMLLKKSGLTRTVLFSSSYANFIVEADARVVLNTSEMFYGFVVRVNPSDQRRFEISNLSEFSIYRDLNQKAISLLFDQGPVKGITGKRDHLKVIAQGDQFAFYVNDLLIGSVTDSGPTRGRVGLEFGSFDANGSVAFSNFKLTQINVPFPMPPPSAQAAPVPPPQPSGSAQYPLPAGKGGLIVRNFYGGQADFTINNQTYILPPSGGEVFIVLDPGHYTWSSHLPGVGQAHGAVDITAGQTRVLPFADR